MYHKVGKKQCSNSGQKWIDINPVESDLIVQPPPLWNFLGLWPPPPHPPGISLRGGGLDIFWNHTITIIIIITQHQNKLYNKWPDKTIYAK